MTIRKLTKLELEVDKIRLEALTAKLTQAAQQDQARVTNREDKLNDRVGLGDWY